MQEIKWNLYQSRENSFCNSSNELNFQIAMLRAVLIDDEEYALTVLSQLLSEFVSIPVKVSGTAKNLYDGIKIINSTKPDVVFLDIDMPEKSFRSSFQGTSFIVHINLTLSTFIT